MAQEKQGGTRGAFWASPARAAVGQLRPSATLCWSASTAGPGQAAGRVRSPVPRCCPAPPPEAAEPRCAQQLPPLGGCSLGKGLWHPNLPPKGQTRGWPMAKHPGAWR